MRILVVDEMHESLSEIMKNYALEYDYYPKITKEEVIKIISNYEGLIIRSKFKVNEEFLTHCAKLKFIARAGAGIDGIDLDAVKKFGIEVLSAAEGNRNAVGEHALGMLLAMFNNINSADFQVKSGIWLREQNRGIELEGKTIGIIGYGNMGKAFAKKLSGFECEVLAFDKYKDFNCKYANCVTLETIFEKTDVLSLHIPLTHETNKMVNKEYILNFKKHIHLINTARGEVIDTKEIIDLLYEGKIASLMLDVLENEKLSTYTTTENEWFNKLIKHPRVLLSPHVAGWTFESYRKINEVLADKINNFVNYNNKIN